MGRRLKLDDQGHLEFYEGTGGGTSKITLRGPATLAADYTLTLPLAQSGASQFLQNDGTGVLSWSNGTASLQSAYANGAKIDANGTVVEIEVDAAAGNTALLIDQDDNQKALDITKDGAGAGDALSILNAGTGRGIFVDQNGAAIALEIDHDGAAVALSVNQGTANTAVDITQQAAAAALNVVGGAAGAVVIGQANNNRAISVMKTGAGAGEAVFIDNDGTGIGLSVVQDGAGVAVDIDQDGGAIALNVDQSTNNIALKVLKTGTGAGSCVSIENDGTSPALFVQQDGNGFGISVQSAATSNPALSLVMTSSSRGLLQIGGNVADPAGPSAGDIWYNSSSDGQLRYRNTTSNTISIGSHHYINIADPGDGNTITPPTTSNFKCDFTNSTGAQTRVLADPAFIGQRAILTALFSGGGTTTTINESTGWLGGGTADDVATFNTSGEIIEAVAVSLTEWRASSSFGVTYA